MKEIKATVYQFSELCEDVKKKIVDRERFKIMDNAMEVYGDDYHGTLLKLQEAVHCKARNWEVGYCDYHYRLDFGDHPMFENMKIDDICGKYLFRFVDSIMPDFWKGKYFSTPGYYVDGKYHYRFRHSRITLDRMSCPLTGMCYEYPFEKVLYKYYDNWHTYPASYSLRDLMNDCFDAFFSAWYEEYHYWASDEGVIDQIENSSHYADERFFEDGTECHDLAYFAA